MRGRAGGGHCRGRLGARNWQAGVHEGPMVSIAHEIFLRMRYWTSMQNVNDIIELR